MAVPAFTEIYYFFRPSQSDTYTVVSFHRIQLYHLPKKKIGSGKERNPWRDATLTTSKPKKRQSGKVGENFSPFCSLNMDLVYI